MDNHEPMEKRVHEADAEGAPYCGGEGFLLNQVKWFEFNRFSVGPSDLVTCTTCRRNKKWHDDAKPRFREVNIEKGRLQTARKGW